MSGTLFGEEVENTRCRHGQDESVCPFCISAPTPPSVHHSETSSEASGRIQSKASGLRDLVYNAIKNSLSGLTDEEIVSATGLKQNTARPRRVELAHETPPRIRSQGTRKTSSGRSAQIWVDAKGGEASDQHG